MTGSFRLTNGVIGKKAMRGETNGIVLGVVSTFFPIHNEELVKHAKAIGR